MPRFLILDVGAGTLDVLFYDTDTNLHYKAVARSPVRAVAEMAAALSGDLLLGGFSPWTWHPRIPWVPCSRGDKSEDSSRITRRD
jgi:hypothetical protein